MPNIARGALYLAMQITGCRDEAMDILQSAVLKSMEHRNAPRPGEHGYRAWFYRVVHNQAVDWLRSRRKFDDNAPADEGSDDVDPQRQLEQEQRRLMVHRALARLTAKQREIICLKDFHDLTYNEIAQVMGIEKGTVMSRLHRARMALRQELLSEVKEPGGMHEV